MNLYQLRRYIGKQFKMKNLANRPGTIGTYSNIWPGIYIVKDAYYSNRRMCNVIEFIDSSDNEEYIIKLKFVEFL